MYSAVFQKISKITLVTSLLTLLCVGTIIPTKKAEAIPVVDAIGNALISAGNAILSSILVLNQQTIGGTAPALTPVAWAGRVAIKLALHRLTKSIVVWIDSGFNGNPGFITNPEEFLRDTADIVIGDFLINNTALDFLCDPFKINVKLAIGLQYQPFATNIRCRLTDALANYDDFVNGDFIGGGGWDSWLQITTIPQNNQMGAMILAQTELDARITGSKEAELAKGAWSGGFLSWEKCTNINNGETEHGNLGSIQVSGNNGAARAEGDDVTPALDEFGAPVPLNDEEAAASLKNTIKGPSNTFCEIQTPGKEIVDQLGWAKSSTVRELEISNDLDAIFNALANQVIRLGVDYFSSAVSEDDTNEDETDTYGIYTAYLNSLQQSQQNQGSNFGGGSSSGGVNYNSSGSVNFSQNNATADTATRAIDAQISLERQYLTAQGNIFRLLEETRTMFNSSSCSTAVKNDVNEQIAGDFIGTKDLVWNQTDISRAMGTSTENIARLENANEDIADATSNTQIMSILTPLNSLDVSTALEVTAFSVDGSVYNQIKNWVVSKVNTYGSSCNLDTDGLSEWGIE